MQASSFYILLNILKFLCSYCFSNIMFSSFLSLILVLMSNLNCIYNYRFFTSFNILSLLLIFDTSYFYSVNFLSCCFINFNLLFLKSKLFLLFWKILFLSLWGFKFYYFNTSLCIITLLKL